MNRHFFRSHDIILGDITSNGIQIANATLIFRLKNQNGNNSHGFTENSVAYWIDELIFGSSVKVSKQHPLGKTITKMIDGGKTSNEITDHINDYIFQKGYFKLKDILHYMKNVKDNAFQNGKESQAKIIREALMVREVY